jgi:hypothetical protein
MEQEGALQQRGQGGRLRSQLVRLLHHRQAAWWFALLAVAGVAQFVSVIGITFILFPTMGRLGYDLDRMSSTNLVAVSLAVSIGVALAASLYASRKYKKTFFDPPSNRIHRRDWHGYATKTGVAIAVPVAYITFVIWALLVLGLVVAARHLVSFPGLPGNPLVWIVPVPAGLALWAFVAWRHVLLEVLETAEPPELRLAANLKQHADVFQEWAKALEAAFEEAEAISKKVQQGIELEQEQLREIREQYRLQAQLIELSDRAPVIRTAIAQEHARGARWGLLVNVVVAAVFYVIGLLTDALVDTEALGDQLRQWFHLG